MTGAVPKGLGVVAALLTAASGSVALAAGHGRAYKPGQVTPTTLARAQRQVPFRIRTPAQVPAPLYLRGVAVGYPAIPNAPKAVDVTLDYANRHGPGLVILEQLGHQPPKLGVLDGIPFTQEARPKNMPGVPNELTLYFGNLVCSLTSPMPMDELKRIAISLSAKPFDGTANRSMACIRKAKAPGRVVDCWVGTVDGHKFRFITWNDKGNILGYTLTSQGRSYRGTHGPYFVYEFSGPYVCWTAQAQAAGGAVDLLNGHHVNPEFGGRQAKVFDSACVPAARAYYAGYVLGLRSHWKVPPPGFGG